MAEQQPDSLAVAFPSGRDGKGDVKYDRVSFRELNAESDLVASGLETIGISKGVRTVLMVEPSLEFFALTFAIFKTGAVPVMVDPGMGMENLKQCLAEAEPEAFIGIPKAHIARKLFGWAKKTVRINVTVGRRLFWGGHTLEGLRRVGQADKPYRMAETGADETAAVLFTSGSTGVPKGAVYTHGNFTAQVEALKKLYDIQPGELDMPTFPLFALFDPALGMSAIIPDMDFTRPGFVDPQNVIEPIQKFEITNMFGSPAFIRRVGEHAAANDVKLPSLKRVISAGAPVPAEVVETFAQMLSDGVQIFTPYGATESLPVASIGSKEILGDTREQSDNGAGVCVGPPVADIHVSVIRITDDAIGTWSEDLLSAAGETGEIVVKGPMVTRSYLNRDESTKLAKIQDPANGTFYHRMGDLGYFDDQGRLWFCGRKAHRVETANETLFTIPCESVFNTHADVFRTALVGVRKSETIPVLCVQLKKDSRAGGDKVKEDLLAIGQKHPHTKNIKMILFHSDFPVDIRHNAKIFREELAIWAGEQLL